MAGSFGKRGNPPQPVQHVIGKEHFGFLEVLGMKALNRADRPNTIYRCETCRS